ncbi:hypothetical protein [Caballeronia sordidicola]|uniref:hypothetical protein n=1 Tax=Caballeronia sordidicola TaxID=196367 RepID=UPI00117EBFC8|nr:hypothetical protein [Caballeronia sordidicola]
MSLNNGALAQIHLESHGDNSPNTVNIISRVNPKQLVPQIRAEIRRFDSSKDQSLHKIAGDFDNGDLASALADAQKASEQARGDSARLASLQFVSGQALLLSNMPGPALQAFQAAMLLAPTECQYRSWTALLLASSGRTNEAYSALAPASPIVEQCEKAGGDVVQAMIHFARAIVATDQRDEQGSIAEMDATDTSLKRLLAHSTVDTEFYGVVLSCEFSRAKQTWWESGTQLRWPDAELRCQQAGRQAELKYPGAATLANFEGSNWDDIRDAQRRTGRVDRLTAQITNRSATGTIKRFGIDDMQRLVILGSLHLERGFEKLWSTHDANGALSDYRQSFELLSSPASVFIPDAVKAYANLGFKMTHAEQLTGKAIIPDSTHAFGAWLSLLGTSSTEVDTPEVCDSLLWAFALSKKLNSDAAPNLDKKLNSCRFVYQKGSLQELEFQAQLSEMQSDSSVLSKDYVNATEKLDVAIAARRALQGFPYGSRSDDQLSTDLTNRSRLRYAVGKVDLAIQDVTDVIALSRSHDDKRHLGESLRILASETGFGTGDTAKALNLIEQSITLNTAEYRSPDHADMSCYYLRDLGMALQVKTALFEKEHDWEKARSTVQLLLDKTLVNTFSCHELLFDGDKSDETPVKNELYAQIVDAGWAQKILAAIATGTGERSAETTRLLSLADKQRDELHTTAESWPLVSVLRDN